MATATLPPGSLQRMVRPFTHGATLRETSAPQPRIINARLATTALNHAGEVWWRNAINPANSTMATMIGQRRREPFPVGCIAR